MEYNVATVNSNEKSPLLRPAQQYQQQHHNSLSKPFVVYRKRSPYRSGWICIGFIIVVTGLIVLFSVAWHPIVDHWGKRIISPWFKREVDDKGWLSIWPFGGSVLIAVFGSILLGWILYKLIEKVTLHTFMKKVKRLKEKDNYESIILPDTDFKSALEAKEEAKRILTMTASQLLAEIHSGRLTSERAVTFLCRRAVQCDSRYNCLADQYFVCNYCIHASCRTCQNFRRLFSEDRKLIGPLHGLPVSVKDCFHLEGTDSTNGIATKSKNSSLVQILKDAGAIPFVKTNVMQCLLGYESSNPIWGAVSNPWDTKRTRGSSGGEAALISSYGSPLGFGTDIGGSIRVPAHYCGIFGFKPTGKRMSGLGQEGWGGGQEAIQDSAGPLARNIDDLVLASRAQRQSEFDCTVPPVPWREDIFLRKGNQKPRFGYFVNSKFVEASPACSRAVQQTVQLLMQSGYEVVPFEMDEGVFMDFYLGLMSADGFETVQKDLEGSQIDESLKGTILLASLPSWCVRFLSH